MGFRCYLIRVQNKTDLVKLQFDIDSMPHCDYKICGFLKCNNEVLTTHRYDNYFPNFGGKKIFDQGDILAIVQGDGSRGWFFSHELLDHLQSEQVEKGGYRALNTEPIQNPF